MSTPTAREALSRLIFDIKALTAESEGVAGLHQNGDVAPWSELLEGGEFSPWLGDAIADASQALAPEVAIPGEQWTDIDGPVLWWMLPINEGQVPHLGHLPPSLRHSQRFVFTRLPPCPVAPTCTPENEAP